jgi:hypothetical protein
VVRYCWDRLSSSKDQVRKEDGVRAALVTIILCALVNVIDGPRHGECLL